METKLNERFLHTSALAFPMAYYGTKLYTTYLLMHIELPEDLGSVKQMLIIHDSSITLSVAFPFLSCDHLRLGDWHTSSRSRLAAAGSGQAPSSIH
jgi:hypothetical protein